MHEIFSARNIILCLSSVGPVTCSGRFAYNFFICLKYSSQLIDFVSHGYSMDLIPETERNNTGLCGGLLLPRMVAAVLRVQSKDSLWSGPEKGTTSFRFHSTREIYGHL